MAFNENSYVENFIDRHLALVSAALVAFIATLKVYFVASFEVSTALTILAIVDRTHLLMSTILTSLVFLVPIGFAQKPVRDWILKGNESGSSFILQLRTALIWIPLVSVLAATITLPIIIGTFLGWLILVCYRFIRNKMDRPVEESQSPTVAAPFIQSTASWVAAAVIGLAAATILDQPWLPPEQIKLTDGTQVVGSVVGDQGEMTFILGESKYDTQWVKTEDIQARELCAEEPRWFTATLYSFGPKTGVSCSQEREEWSGIEP